MRVRFSLLLLISLLASAATAQTIFASGLDDPRDLTQLADGRVLVAEFGVSDQVSAFAPDGTFLGVFADGLQDPTGILALADGRVLVTEFNDSRVVVLSADGSTQETFVAEFGQNGNGGPFDAVQLSDGRILISDNYSDQVLAFDPSGATVGVFATSITDPPGVARGILPLPDGRVLVTYTGPLEVIQIFGSGSGVFATSTGWGAGQMARLPDGRILALDWFFGEIRAFLPDGTDLGVIASIQDVLAGLLVLADGRVLVSGTSGTVYDITVQTASEASPLAVVLGAASPNPTHGRSVVTLTVEDTDPVRVEIVDLLGRRIRRVHEGPLAPGVEHRLEVDAGGLAPGVYRVRVQSENGSWSQPLTIVR